MKVAPEMAEFRIISEPIPHAMLGDLLSEVGGSETQLVEHMRKLGMILINGGWVENHQ